MADPKGSEITPPDVYLRRRELLKKAGCSRPLQACGALIYAGILALLLGARVVHAYRRRQTRRLAAQRH